MVYFRKRLTPEVLGEINEMILRDAAKTELPFREILYILYTSTGNGVPCRIYSPAAPPCKRTGTVDELTAENKRLRQKLERMNELLLNAQRAQFGPSSEKRGWTERKFFNTAWRFDPPG